MSFNIIDFNNVIFKKRIPHNEIPEFLCALDVFVLPTLVEGCSNAIIEAMASGLPIISSNYSFNDDILDESMSFVIDPLDVSNIREKILKLKDNQELRIEMAKGSRTRSAKFNIYGRVDRIINFMQRNIGKF